MIGLFPLIAARLQAGRSTRHGAIRSLETGVHKGRQGRRQNEKPRNQWLHLTGLIYAEIGVTGVVQRILNRRFSGKPARQVSQPSGRPLRAHPALRLSYTVGAPSESEDRTTRGVL
jgi:hypothetical protein